MENSPTFDKENEAKLIKEYANMNNAAKQSTGLNDSDGSVFENRQNQDTFNDKHEIENQESKGQDLTMNGNHDNGTDESHQNDDDGHLTSQGKQTSNLNDTSTERALPAQNQNTIPSIVQDEVKSDYQTSDGVGSQIDNQNENIFSDEQQKTHDDIQLHESCKADESRNGVSPEDKSEDCTSAIVIEKEESSSDEPPELDDGLPDDEPSGRSRIDSPFDIVEDEEIESVKEDAERLIEEERKRKEEAERKAKEESERENEDCANGGSDWLNVLGNDQLKKKTKHAGIGVALEKGQQITMKYSLMLASGKEVDKDVVQTFTLGDGEVIAAIDLTCNLAKVGEVFDVVTNSRFAYETFGKPPHIPPKSSLLIEIEILRCEDTPAVEDLTEEERVVIGDRKRKIGNEFFERMDFGSASKNYKCAAKYLDPPSYKLEKEDSDETKELKFKNWCNLALSELKACNISGGLTAADRALEIFPDSSKAMYRKGKLLFEKGDFDGAQKILSKACKLDPNSTGCKQFLKEITTTIATQKKKQQQMYKKMFNLDSDPSKAPNNYESGSWLQGAIPMIAGSIAVGAFAVAGYFGLKSLNQ